MNITVKTFFAGSEAFISKAGKKWGNVYLHPVKADGSHELKQTQAKVFGDDLVEKLSQVKPALSPMGIAFTYS